MDTLTAREFMGIFDRMTEYLDLEGCKTKEDIEWEILNSIAIMKRGVRKAKRESTKRRWNRMVQLMYVLGKDGVPSKSKELRGKPRVSFARRAIQYAEIHPRSRLALTLKYGKDKAKKILRERLLKRLRTLAKRK